MLKIYLDDCADHNLLANLLRQAGHQVKTPREAGGTGTIGKAVADVLAAEHEVIRVGNRFYHRLW